MSLLQLENITKTFGSVTALRGVSFELDYGEVVAIAGDNGAGKSTLMKILSGAVTPDSGSIDFEQEPVRLGSPAESRSRGIEMVYQDLGVCDTVDVALNLFLGREPIKRVFGFPLIDTVKAHEQAEQILRELEISVPSTHTFVNKLSGGQRQAVAIGRSVMFDPKLLILDEPTAALAVKEVNKVLDTIRALKRKGVGIILISHRLQDLLDVSDRLIVMFEGQKVADQQTKGTSLEQLVRLIVQDDKYHNQIESEGAE